VKKIYLAVRCAYPNREEVIGVYSNLSAANLCVRDSWYPRKGRVVPITLSDVQNTYTSISSYKDWERTARDTYYHFSDGSTTVPNHWRSSVEIESIKRSIFYSLESPEDVFDLPEESLISIMAFMLCDDYEEVLVIRETTPGAMALLQLGEKLRPLARGRGGPDRGRLVDVCYTLLSLYWQAKDGGELFFDKGGRAVDRFWRYFVIGHSNAPDEWFSDWF